MAGSDSEDDYMSADFLASMGDVKPGVSSNREHRRRLKLEEKREVIRSTKVLKKGELEKVKRDEALSKPISQESKGFALLAKMGYKPGMKLGAQKDGQSNGLAEPLPLDLKMTRTGLGHEAEAEKQSKDRVEAHLKNMKERAAMHNVLLGDFRKRKRNQGEQKIVIGDIMKSRKACHELDTRQDLELPVEDWHWPIYREKKATDEPTTSILTKKRVPPKRRDVPFSDEEDEHDLQDEDDEISYVYANGQPAPREDRLRDLTADELDEKLRSITDHLRVTHLYCVWCGHQYESEVELDDQCPGVTRCDHE